MVGYASTAFSQQNLPEVIVIRVQVSETGEIS